MTAQPSEDAVERAWRDACEQLHIEGIDWDREEQAAQAQQLFSIGYRAALAAGGGADRKAIIEECARIAESEKYDPAHVRDGSEQSIYNLACQDVADAIRALVTDSGAGT